MANTTEKRARSGNFSNNEKVFLINLVAKYKNIIENKKTDGVTNMEKIKAWGNICQEFNAVSPGNTFRNKDVLKRFYENKKKELRKKVAETKMELKKTGGGPPPDEKKDPFDDVLLSIVNEKTVTGLPSEFGGDVSDEEPMAEQSSSAFNDNIEIIFEPDNSHHPTDVQLSHQKIHEKEDGNIRNSIEFLNTFSGESQHAEDCEEPRWKKYKMSDLQKPISSPLMKDSFSPTSLPHTSKKISSEERKSENEKTPNTKSASRRRPTVMVKALTSSDVASKYNALLDCRLEIGALVKKKSEQDLAHSIAKHEKEMILLDLQIEVEKEKLKRLKRNDF